MNWRPRVSPALARGLGDLHSFGRGALTRFAEGLLFDLADTTRSIVARTLRPWRRVRSGEGLGAILFATALTPIFGIVLSGCATDEIPRLPRTKAQLIDERRAEEAQGMVLRRETIHRNVTRIKAKYDEYVAGRAPAPPVVDLLVLSGGGDWGAFGAGVLKGWGQVNGPLARPTFDAVTGVSTGALIAPFAFLGDDASIDKIVDLYRHPQSNWFRPRSLLAFLTGGASYADIPGLEEDMRRALDEVTMRRLVEAGKDGRLLAVNTSNLDFGDMRAWDIVAETNRALETGNPNRLYDILLASAGVPGAFPPRLIDGDLYVDGGITGNILYGGRVSREDGFVTVWTRSYPGTPVPKTRYWVIFNNQLRPPPEVVQPNWKSVVPRSLLASTRTATVNGIRHLFALAEVSRLSSGTEVEVRYIAVPDDWEPSQSGLFIKEVMNALADMGERMGADLASWRTDPP
jgi:predicted acylesterase/phospholipase RssA